MVKSVKNRYKLTNFGRNLSKNDRNGQNYGLNDPKGGKKCQKSIEIGKDYEIIIFAIKKYL
jgi:hypothetical protein